MKRRGLIAVGMVCAIVFGSAFTAAAQENYPTKPITIIVPEVPGSAADLLSRIIGKAIGDAPAQP